MAPLKSLKLEKGYILLVVKLTMYAYLFVT